MNLIIDKTNFPDVSIETLKSEVEKLREIEFCEVWLEENKKSFCLLKSSGNAFLIYLQEDGDISFSSLNPDADSNDFIEFYLSDGQKDLYSKKQTVSFEQGKTAFFHFFKTGEMDKRIDWNED